MSTPRVGRASDASSACATTIDAERAEFADRDRHPSDFCGFRGFRVVRRVGWLSGPQTYLVSAMRTQFLCALSVLAAIPLTAQAPAPTVTRLAVLQAEHRRAPNARDLALLRSGTRSTDPQTARFAVRALGRLERPSLVADILPVLKHALPELRAEAANALGQALEGTKPDDTVHAAAADTVVGALITRLAAETEPAVRSAICETLGRAAITAAHAERVEAVLADAAAREGSIDGRLGIAAGFEALARLHRRDHPPGTAALDAMRSMVSLSPPAGRRPADPSRDVRVRRLALEALLAADGVDDPTLQRAAHDPDPQVRRLAMRAAARAGSGNDVLTAGLSDKAPMVRLEAVRATRSRGAEVLCPAAMAAATDRDPHVALVALDELAGCGSSSDALALLERTAGNAAETAAPRGWHRAARALVSFAAASPERAAPAIAAAAVSKTWQLRMYAARAAAVRKDTALLEKLAGDDEDNVREAAVEGLAKNAGHSADAIFVRQLTRSGYQILRAAAVALEATPTPEAAVPALETAHKRLVEEARDNSHDARTAIEKTLASVGVHVAGRKGGARPPAAGARAIRSADGAEAGAGQNDLDADDLQRLAAARATVTMRGLGRFELVLFTSEASATVLRFVQLAEAGYYNGLTFHRVVPNFVIQGGSPGANEYIGDAAFMRDEVGLWPHVRGAVGISTRGRDTGDAQIFIDLVDNPRLNHEYTVFAYVLSGMEVVDQVLEGDVIESIEIAGR